MTYKNKRKANFRFTEELASVGNAFISSCVMGVLATVFLATPSVYAEEQFMSEETIRSAVKSHLAQAVSARAQRNQWHNYQLKTAIHVPSAAQHLPLCPTAVVISGVDNKTLPVGNLKRSVSCASPSADWRINVTIKASLTLDVVVAKSGINRDEPISAGLIHIERRTLNREQDFFTQPSQVINKTAKRRIRTGQILDSRKLSSPALVAKGNQVVITATKDGFSARTKGIALEEGDYGEQIDVQNSSSGKTIKAVVTGLNQVQTQF
ncbi:flagellar biosynthesis protein FlgA [Vibrio bivalvicida]|uniref:Flagella basal body P-ring formation protein FlgA n=2 Tax=Vibrio bivalvicida TaxID=1276888 RepID=A0A177XZJ4_9VIBR|nr:flagellar biosynthesis protein FlgA [Vibrio bivalvicida]